MGNGEMREMRGMRGQDGVDPFLLPDGGKTR